MNKFLIKILFIFILLNACEKEQTLIKVENRIQYNTYVRIGYYDFDKSKERIELVSFWIEPSDRRTLGAKPGDHAYEWMYYCDTLGYENVQIHYTEKFELREGDTYKIIIE